MQNRLLSTKRVLEPLKVTKVAGDGVISGSWSLRWPGKGRAPYLLLDFGQKVSGLLRIKSRRLDGSYPGVRYAYGPYGDFTPFEFTAGFGDWQSEELCVFRFLKITVASEFPCPAHVAIESVSLVRTEYPLDRTGLFSCDDEELNRIWSAGVDTVQLCVQPNSLAGYAQHYHPENRQWLRDWKSLHSTVPYTIWDGARRDREAWLGDAYFGAFTFLYAGGDFDPVLNNFELWSELQLPDGELIVSAFSRQRFTEYNLWYAAALAFYLQFSGDRQNVQRFWKTFRTVQAWVMNRLDRRALIKVSHDEPRMHTWMYTIKRDGVVTYLQGALYKNLLSAAAVERFFGNEAQAAKYEQTARRAKESVNRYLWDARRGCYKTSIEGKTHYDEVAQDGNVLCLLYGIADGERAKQVRNYLKKHHWTPYGSTTWDRVIHHDRANIYMNSNWSHNRHIWPYINVLEIEALFRNGFERDGLDLARRCFGNMLRQGPGTLWEMALADTGKSPRVPFFQDVYNSFCHAWGGYVSYFLQAFVGGIRPLKPGFSKVLIAPRPCGLKQIRAAVPTPRGPVKMVLKTADDHTVVRVTLPEGVKHEFDRTGIQSKIVDLYVDGRKIL